MRVTIFMHGVGVLSRTMERRKRSCIANPKPFPQLVVLNPAAHLKKPALPCPLVISSHRDREQMADRQSRFFVIGVIALDPNDEPESVALLGQGEGPAGLAPNPAYYFAQNIVRVLPLITPSVR